ncbi:MAG TPA: matrixin family metalloprotease [Polyangiaceae bacterium]|nr:matrixin family metalloprotease [Polyangiaceae bacterium]
MPRTPRVAKRISALGLGAAALFGVLLGAGTAHAYCRTTTCDPKKEQCPTDLHHCATVGVPLLWATGELTVWVDPKGSPLRKIDVDAAALSLSKAFAQWSSARCGGQERPQLNVTVLSGTAAPPEDAQVAVYFRDDHWPYAPTYGALTHLEFDESSGDLVAARTEINSAGQALTVGADGTGIDFDAVIAHETGHVLGLGHTDVAGSTMVPEASGFGSIDLATLGPDDEAGICAIYGPGFSPEEEESVPPPSCTFSHRRGDASSAMTVALGVAAAVLRRRTRSR